MVFVGLSEEAVFRFYLINLLPLDGRAKQIARVVVIILGVISLLKYISV